MFQCFFWKPDGKSEQSVCPLGRGREKEYLQQKKVVKYTQNKLVASQKPLQPVMPGSKFSIIYLDV